MPPVNLFSKFLVMANFPIRRVNRQQAEAVETVGSKPKFWFREGNRRFLFKADDRGTGEDWAEVISCHLCALIDLPHVEYELAAEYQGDALIFPGVICENMAPKPGILALGNELLLAIDPEYPRSQRFKVRQHTVEAVCDLLNILASPSDHWMEGVPDGIKSALDVFVGYIMLDAWIANQDRHHENWGAIWHDKAWRLAPTFDHGAALARNLNDDEREERLVTKDRNRSVAAFAARGRSAFYATVHDTRPLGLLDAFRAFADHAPQAGETWRKRLQCIDQNEITAILHRVPEHRMSKVCQEFTLALLLTNKQRLLE